MQKEIEGDDILAGDVAYVSGKSTAGRTYLAYPNAAVPRFLIPKDDAAGQKFILRLMSADKGLWGALMRTLLRLPGGLFVLRSVIFRSHIVIQK